MNILHIDTEMTWRGGENQTRLLIEGLNKNKIKSHVAAQPGSEIAKRLKNDAVIFEVGMKGGADVIAAKKIANYAKKEQIDVIDCQTGNAHSIALLSQFFYDKPKLIVHRRVDIPPIKNFFSRLKYTSAKIDSFVAISEKIKDVLIDSGLKSQKILCVPSAVDPSVYDSLERDQLKSEFRVKHSLSDETIVLGNASALTTQKGYDVLIKSLSHLAKDGIDFHCFIAGDGHLKSELERLVHSLDLAKKVTFLGWIKKVPEFLSALDILAISSNTEGLGTIIQDGLFAGCCVVATNAGGIPEMIIPNKTGYLASVGDDHGYYLKLKEACQNPSARVSLNQSGVAHIKSKFSLEKMVKGNILVYRNALNS